MTSRTSALQRALRSLAVALTATLALTACDFDVYDLPLPGGTDTGEDPMTVTVQFADVLDLVPESTVKVNDVSVGKVTEVELVDNLAEVTLELRKDTELPANVVAQIRQTSLLGEKFVSLDTPATGASPELLADDAVIPLERTGRNPEVEEVLGALSLVLNGGGVAQLRTIAQELNLALEGREDSARSVLGELDTLMTNLDDNKATIVNAIEALDRLAVTAQDHMDTIDAAMEELPSALVSIDQQRDDLVRTLQALHRLGDVGVRVIRASKEGLIETLHNLEPVLTQLADSGQSLVNSLDTVFTYPFVDEVVGRNPQTARNLHMGDYVNLDLRLELDLSQILTNLTQGEILPSPLNPVEVVDNVVQCLASLDLGSAACQAVLATPAALLRLGEECRKPGNSDNVVCGLFGLLPGLPGELGDLLGGLGLNRAAPGTAAAGPSQPTDVRLHDMYAVYDPDLVNLMVPALATPAPAAAEPTARKGARR